MGDQPRHPMLAMSEAVDCKVDYLRGSVEIMGMALFFGVSAGNHGGPLSPIVIKGGYIYTPL